MVLLSAEVISKSRPRTTCFQSYISCGTYSTVACRSRCLTSYISQSSGKRQLDIIVGLSSWKHLSGIRKIEEKMSSTHSQYKLTYFDARGVAEATRFIFAYAGVPFEDVRIARDDWPAMKPSTPFGQLPLLEIDGKMIGQSAAFARLVAKRYGLAGKEELEQAQVDAIIDYQKDIQAAMAIWWREEDKEKQARLREKFFTGDLQQHLANLERLLQNQEFFVASGPTFADFSIASFFFTINKFYPAILDNFPLLKAHGDRVHNLPGIKDWVDKRPKTEM